MVSFAKVLKLMRAAGAGVCGMAAAALLLIPGAGMAREKAVELPKPALDQPQTAPGPQVAVLAGGCFWGVQAVFQHVKGVHSAVSGYAGGDAGTAHYEMVGTGTTGHAESVEVTFDPKVLSYGEVLRIFFSVVHDPTQLDRQGPDVGTQYRSAVFYADAEQRKIAQAYIAQLEKARVFDNKIVTRLEPLAKFYPAEGYHQDYLILHPGQPYIVFNDLPKVENMKRVFPGEYREAPVTVASTRKR